MIFTMWLMSMGFGVAGIGTILRLFFKTPTEEKEQIYILIKGFFCLLISFVFFYSTVITI